MTHPLLLVLSLLLLFHPSLGAETVSITSVIPSDVHTCIDECLISGFISDLGNAMGCESPYENACYCATESGSFSVADSWLSRCASTSCGRGDLTRDLGSMHSFYASYCMGAGFTQSGATEWYNPATATEEASSTASASEGDSATSDAEPSKTADNGAAETTTQLTVVTQTTEGGSGATKSQVTIHATSTLWVNSDGSPASLNIDDEDDNSSVEIGVGVGIPVAAILAAAFIWWFLRRRRRSVPGASPSEETPSNISTGTPPMSTALVSRKPVAASAVSPVPASSDSKFNELSDAGELKREIDGQEVHPFPIVTPSPPIEVAGRHELKGDVSMGPERKLSELAG